VTSRAALARHPVALAGIVVTTVSAAVFLALAAAVAAGLFPNPYAGLVVFVALPALFLFGLLLIPVGMWLQRRRIKWGLAGDSEWPVIDLGIVRVRRLALTVIGLTAVNIAIFLLAGYGALHWMESPAFCGQTCHTPMHPQFSAWSVSSHAQVACATCHIGEGAKSFVHAKLAGVRQLAHVATNSYPRPIPPGAHGMPQASEVCGRCHVATRDHGVVVRTVREYADDEGNTNTTTVLRMQLGGPGRPTLSGRAIHWHADPAVRVEFVSTDSGRQTIPYVKVTRADGRTTEYVADGTPAGSVPAGVHRVMDCIDCHNTTGHRIAPTAEKAVDTAIGSGRLSTSLPFIRREAVRLLKAEQATEQAALDAIARELRGAYPASAIAAVQDVYRASIFPAMKVVPGTYPDNIGHLTSNGCFRCHDGSHTAPDGSAVSGDCEYCHVQVEEPPVPTSVVPSAN
jgi:NapC/NirT cytochrome c family, N-terminal region